MVFIRKYATILLVCILVAGVLGLAADYIHKAEVRKIESTRDTRLDLYKSSQSIAESYLKVLRISDDTSYQEVKSNLYNVLSGPLQQEVFPSNVYTGPKMEEFGVSVKNVVGEIQGATTFLFKITYEIRTADMQKEKITFVTVKNGKITKVRTL